MRNNLKPKQNGEQTKNLKAPQTRVNDSKVIPKDLHLSHSQYTLQFKIVT